MLEQFRSGYGNDPDVPRNVTLSEAPSHGLPAIIYDLKCAGSQAYIALAKEFLERSNIDGNK